MSGRTTLVSHSSTSATVAARFPDDEPLEPEATGSRPTDPAAAPHGGEPLAELLARAAAWLTTQSQDDHTVAITHSAIVRGVILAVLASPAPSFWRIDIAPLTATVLRGGPARWTPRAAGRDLAPRR